MSDPTTTDPTAPASEGPAEAAGPASEGPAEAAGPASEGPNDELASEAPGQIVTFYSYKGGVGRSMALSNIAVILARDFGLRVVMVDWDLEAPGLHRYFGIPDAESGRGVIDFFTNYKQLLSRPPDEIEIEPDDLDISGYARLIEEYDTGGTIAFISAGDQSDVPLYVDRVSGFDWDDFYRNWNGAQLIEAVRAQLHQLGDVILIDSRTGITDTGGICTLHLPDIVVLVFAFNSQNLDGIARIAAEISGKNEAFEITNRHPEALFLPSRKNTNEIAQLRHWEARAVELFEPYLLASPRIVERFGDDTLEWVREASVPYVPYFSFGEELAARTDKGYEMVKALEVLASMISPSPPLIVPRKSPSSQPHFAAPSRETSGITAQAMGPPRPPSGPMAPMATPQSAQVAIPPSAKRAPAPAIVQTGSQKIPKRNRLAGDEAAVSEAADFEADSSPVRDGVSPTKQAELEPPLSSAPPQRRAWPVLGVLGVVALVSVMFIWLSPIQLWGTHTGAEESGSVGEAGHDTDTEGQEFGETEDVESEGARLEPGQLRAEVRFEFLSVYSRHRPPPEPFEGLGCELAIGEGPQSSGWHQAWALDEFEVELRTSSVSLGRKLSDETSAQSIVYKDFELIGADAELPVLAELGGRAVAARLMGPDGDPGWLTRAWEVAEAQNLGRDEVWKQFSLFYSLKDEAELLVEPTPVVARMLLEYAGQPIAELAGWVARDPAREGDLVVFFIPSEIGGIGENGPALASVNQQLSPYIEPRDQRAEWLAGIRGQGKYSIKGSKRYYYLSVAVPSTAIEEIERVRYELPDNEIIEVTNAGSRDDWPAVPKARRGCEGLVNISIIRTDGVILPLTFDWCQDAVKYSGSSASVESSPLDRSRCNKNLIGKNPHLAAQVCAEEWEDTTDPAERKRLLTNLLAATRDYDARQYCLWLREAAEIGNLDAALILSEIGGRCDPAVMGPPQPEQRQEKKRGPRKPKSSG